MKRIALFPSWKIEKNSNDYFIPYTHYVYLEYIASCYDEIELIAPVRVVDGKPTTMHINFPNIKIVELPNFNGYAGGLLKFRSIIKAMKQCNSDLFYVRPPSPLSWVPSIILKKKTIMHFVGDIIGSTLKSQSQNRLISYLKVAMYIPEYVMVILAARRSIVYTNGNAVANKISRYGVKPISLVSSTLKDEEIVDLSDLRTETNSVMTLSYLGYLRPAKGICTIIDLIKKLELDKVNYQFNIIGNGEMKNELVAFIESNGLSDKVILHGHIEDRMLINKILFESDLFVFPSLSEGSPRAVLEAMAQGVCVVSTPVGSLPSTFIDQEEIVFVDYNDEDAIFKVVKEYMSNRQKFNQIRRNALVKVKGNMTLNSFLSKIFKI